MRVGIIGPGRLGRTLAAVLPTAGHEVDLRGRGDGWPTDCAAVLLTVPDRAIAAVARAFPVGVPVLHCSGACDLDVLAPHRAAGSLHPLMTFPGPEVAIPDLAGVPAAIDGPPDVAALARQLAIDLGMWPFAVPGDRRLYHAAAVMAGNFATVLLADASRVLAAAGVPEADAPRILLPLAVQSLRNAATSPADALTGPAARGDEDVVRAHREALAEAELTALLSLYDILCDRAAALVVDRGRRRG